MYKLTIFLLFVLLFNNLKGQSPEYIQLISEGYKLYEDKQFEQSWQKYNEAFNIDSTDASDLYNGACVAALAGKSDLAIKTLLKAIHNGYVNKAHLLTDSDLNSLRSLPEWPQIMNEITLKKERYRTDDILFKDLKGYIERNRADSLTMLCSDTFKTKISGEELKFKVNMLFNLISQNAEKKFKSLEQGSSQSSNVVMTNGRMKETRSFTYRYIPPFFGDYTNNLLFTNVGYNIELEIAKIKNEWFLNNLEIYSNYLSRDFELNTLLNEMFFGKDTCMIQYRIVRNDKRLVGDVVIISGQQKFFKWFKNPQFMEMDDFVKPAGEKPTLMSVSFYKKVVDKNSIWNFRTIRALELIFFDDGSNQCFISNGEKYAFYKLENIAPIKNFIYKEIQSVK
jgi:hypothetical protein